VVTSYSVLAENSTITFLIRVSSKCVGKALEEASGFLETRYTGNKYINPIKVTLAQDG